MKIRSTNMKLHIPFLFVAEDVRTKIYILRKEMLNMQRNMIRVSVRGGESRISESMLKNVLNESNLSREGESEHEKSCKRYEGCDFPSLAMVYAPCQKWHQLYDMETALVCGTLFKELNKPFECGRGDCSGTGRGGKCNGM